MRGTVDGLASPHPLGEALPAVYQEDDFTQRFTGGLDTVLAPVLAALDNFDAYLDPALTPPDFLAWLARWVGVVPDERWEEARMRAAVASAVELYRLRGTAAALKEQVELETGGTVEIIENGATGWSVDANADLPGSADPIVVVRLAVADPRAIDPVRLDALVESAKPAHVPHRIEVLRIGAKASAAGEAGAPPASSRSSARSARSGATRGAEMPDTPAVPEATSEPDPGPEPDTEQTPPAEGG